MVWTSVGHTARHTRSWQEGLFPSRSFFDNRLQAAICASVGHLLPAPTAALVSAPHTSIVVMAPVHPLRDCWLPGQGTSTSRAERDSGLWALVPALARISSMTIDKPLLFSRLCFVVGKGLGGLDLTALTIQERMDSRDQ